jgi:PBSX family phage portal protein
MATGEMTTREQMRKSLTSELLLDSLLAKADREGLESRQLTEEGTFNSDWMKEQSILKPPYDPVKLYGIVENSSILPQCIDAMALNTDGFGINFFYTGDSEHEKSTEVLAEKQLLTDFFSKVNENQSFTTVRKEMRSDMETTGNGYLEIIRTTGGEIGLIYQADSRYIRLQKKQKDPQQIKVKMKRGSKDITVTVNKRFRKFVMITSTARNDYRWFKEYGDPRPMNAANGKYKGEDGYKEGNEATEILHFKIGTDTYGVPRWSGNVMNAMGLHSADYVNYDLFENQVVPPLAIMVSGGKLTSESVEDIKSILVQKKGVENFHKVLVLEAESEGDVGQNTSVKITIQEISTARKEDSMFVQYIDGGEHRVRGSFRLPPLYLGRADTYSKSTADSSKMVAEEQVFVPERELFDEIINLTIMEELGAKYHAFKSKGPRLITGEQIIAGFKEFGKLGVFTINEGIRVANRTLGLDITTYDQKWADYPVAIVLELAKLGMLAEVDEISSASQTITGLLEGVEDPAQAAKVYQAFSKLHKSLKEHSEQRELEEKASSSEPDSLFEIKDTSEAA